MTITDEKLLKEFRAAGPCEWCGRWSNPRVPNHIVLRGIGGARRLDVPFNLIRLGHDFACTCHADFHKGVLTADDFFAVVARREGCFQDDIRAALNVLRELDRSPSAFQVRRALAQVGERARGLAAEALEGVL